MGCFLTVLALPMLPFGVFPDSLQLDIQVDLPGAVIYVVVVIDVLIQTQVQVVNLPDFFQAASEYEGSSTIKP